MKHILLLAIAALSGCAPVPSETDLIGAYSASYRKDQATLILKKDGSYVHVITTSEGKRIENIATWRLDRDFKYGPIVDFVDFIFVPAYKEFEGGNWSTYVERSWAGRIELCFNSDQGYCYVKQE